MYKFNDLADEGVGDDKDEFNDKSEAPANMGVGDKLQNKLQV